MSSVVTFGAAGIGRVQQDVADRAIAAALAHGVNHIDVAPRYGDAELRLKPWIPKIRKDVFLGCKTVERTREAAKAELHRSLERLGTDRLDLYQHHSVGKLADLDACTAKGGRSRRSWRPERRDWCGGSASRGTRTMPRARTSRRSGASTSTPSCSP
jgi:aryl-alcohol dehydrogenase-like predicted oxidoreductase